MKRSPMKRGSKPMRRGPGPKKRAILATLGKVAGRDRFDRAEFRAAVMRRAGGYCERCACRVGADHLEAHHVVRRSRCVGWPDRHDPEANGAAVCFPCHRSLDLDPMDVGGPLEWLAQRAHSRFEEWRRDRAIFLA